MTHQVGGQPGRGGLFLPPVVGRGTGPNSPNPTPVRSYTNSRVSNLTSRLRLSSRTSLLLSLAQRSKYIWASSTRPWVRSQRADSGTHLWNRQETSRLQNQYLHHTSQHPTIPPSTPPYLPAPMPHLPPCHTTCFYSWRPSQAGRLSIPQALQTSYCHLKSNLKSHILPHCLTQA